MSQQSFMKMLTRIHFLPPGAYVFQQTRTFFKIIQDIIKKMKNAPPHGGHYVLTLLREKCPDVVAIFFQPTVIIFEFFHDYIGTNLLTKFHEDRIINVDSKKNARPPCDHVFKQL
ncbi:hypothetical protein DPMN_019176 [Dreissena polymorpha]|uniref:Uncharacterized protein n=1 Tax=Dreissena polymorpha TaxID=45954 RepID=A0A9D4NIR0_DREPO|nr:hypothetical protein DPMN_019176 [Dreissena polymorpha]